MPLDSLYRPLPAVGTCSHLSTGRHLEGGGFYPRCRVGDASARVRWVEAISARRLAELRALQRELTPALLTALEQLWAAKARSVEASAAAVNTAAARAQLQCAAATYILTLDRLLVDRGDRFEALGLPVESCMRLIRGIVEIWMHQEDTTIPEIPDFLLEGFPETMRLLFKPVPVQSG